jgi:hypothetical protein
MPESLSNSPRRWQRADSLALAVCILAGVLLAMLPHIISAVRYHDPYWAADYDDVECYGPVISQAYFNHPFTLGDGVHDDGSAGMYDRMQFVPFILAARAMHLGPQRVTMLMRLFGGITIPIATFCLLRSLIGNRWLICAVCLLFLADAGTITGAPMVRMIRQAIELLRGNTGEMFATLPHLQPQWRILNPAGTLAWLMLAVWMLLLVHETASKRRVVVAGISVGVLFYILAFYWTSVMLALVILLVASPARRRSYLTVGAIALVIGMPSLISTVHAGAHAHPDWRLRAEKLMPIGHFQELLIPRAACAIAIGSALWIWKCRSARKAAPLLAMLIAGLLLTNHQIVTGLQLENFHWDYAWGPCAWLLAIVMLTCCLSTARWFAPAMLFLSALFVALALWMRALEATRSAESILLTSQYRAFVANQSNREPLRPNAVIAGDPAAVNFAVLLENQRPLSGYPILICPSISNDQWHRRRALNQILLGQSRGEYEQDLRKRLSIGWGPWSRDSRRRDEEIARAMAIFDDVAKDPEKTCDEFRVDYVAVSPTEIRKRERSR